MHARQKLHDVLMFGWELPPYNTGGLGVACYGLAKSLSHQGVNIAFGLPRQLPVNLPFMKVMDHPLRGVQVVAINSLLQAYMGQKDYYHAHTKYSPMPFYGGSIYHEAMRFADLGVEWSKQVPHTLIHAHDWMSYPAGQRASKVSRKPWIAHVHATEYDRTGGNLDNRIAEVEYQGLHDADHIITVSNYTKETVHKYYSIPKDKISVVHNGVDLEEFKPATIREIFPNDHIVLYVGRLTFQKGVEYFIRAAKEVLAVHPNTVFLVVGNGDMYQQHVMESASLRIGNRIIFTGFLNGDKLRSVYQMSDVFVMPSVSEPYGIVALEAIASGIPAIISKQSGVSETINSVYKVDFWDTHKMARYINTVLSYPAHAGELNRLAKQEASLLTWERAAHQTLAVYQEVSP
jgi:glycosyltransferase involved in cell wall biosynthesis